MGREAAVPREEEEVDLRQEAEEEVVVELDDAAIPTLATLDLVTTTRTQQHHLRPHRQLLSLAMNSHSPPLPREWRIRRLSSRSAGRVGRRGWLFPTWSWGRRPRMCD